MEQMTDALNSRYKDEVCSLGLVHRDFKHWNTNVESGLLIYDFEEAVTDGPPLEDLFNYHIDPIISHVSAEKVIEEIFQKEHLQEYGRYLKALQIDVPFEALLYCYVLEKILFYQADEYRQTREKYINLLQELMKLEHEKD